MASQEVDAVAGNELSTLLNGSASASASSSVVVDDDDDDSVEASSSSGSELNLNIDLNPNKRKRSSSSDDDNDSPDIRQRTDDGESLVADRLIAKRNYAAKRRSRVDKLLDELINRRNGIDDELKSARKNAEEDGYRIHLSPSTDAFHKNLCAAIARLTKLKEQQFTQREQSKKERADDTRILTVPVDPPEETLVTSIFCESNRYSYCFLCYMAQTNRVADSSIDSLSQFWFDHVDTVDPIVLTLQEQAYFTKTIREPSLKLGGNELPIPEWSSRSIYDHFNGEHGWHPIIWRLKRLRETKEAIKQIRHHGMYVVPADELAGKQTAISVSLNASVDLTHVQSYVKLVQLEQSLMKLNPRTLYTTDTTPLPAETIDTYVKPSSGRRRQIRTISRLTTASSQSEKKWQ